MAEETSATLDPLVPAQLRLLFRGHGFRPQRRLGQTFLVDRNIAHKIVRAARLTPEEQVVEVGAGAGAVTVPLTHAAGRVLALEVDPRLVAILRETVGAAAEIVEGDLLALNWEEVLSPRRSGSWRVVANLPYAITGPAILKLLEGAGWFSRMVIMVQEEVAQRLLAPPGDRQRGLLTVLVEAAAEASSLGRVSRTCFFPRPRVDSAMLALDVRRPEMVPPAFADCFRKLVRAAFSSRRKTLANAISHAYRPELSKQEASGLLSQCGLDPSRRAETVSVEEFLLLAKGLTAKRMDAAQ